MAVFLVWNVNRKPLDGLVQSLVRQHQIDVVLLVEYAFGVSKLPGLLLRDGLVKRTSSERFGVFVRGTHQFSRLRYRIGKGRRGRGNVWRWRPPSGQEGLIALVHGPDRRNHDDSTRRVFFHRVAEAIRSGEARWAHTRSLVTGDFNAHPFESAVVDSDGLHAIGLPTVGGGVDRTVGRERVQFFYSPMWRLYGQSPHPAAAASTYYRLRSGAHELGWHMLDQVVIRPGELVRFPESELRIVTQVGTASLLDAAGRPDTRNASDHLPLLFRWNL